MRENDDTGGWIKWAIGVVLVPIVVALIGASYFHVLPLDFNTSAAPAPAAAPGAQQTEAEITLSRATAPRGWGVTP